FLTQWGSQGSDPGQFGGPNSVAFDSAGNVCVIDANNARLTIFDSNGNYLLQFGSLGSGIGQFNTPFRLAFNPSHNVLYVPEFANNRVQALNYSVPSPIITCQPNRVVECGTPWNFDQP